MKTLLTILAAVFCLSGAVEAKSRHHPPPNQSSKFDYYVMSLSWSPTFCETHQTNPQCDKHFGFVLHGLWPTERRECAAFRDFVVSRGAEWAHCRTTAAT